ncbi:MAG: LapA family protein [Pseudomonadota bacterium]
MRILLWLFRTLLFLSLLFFALKNNDPVNVHFFFDALWQAPLILVVLAFFTAGALFAGLSLLSIIFRLRRELKQQQRLTQAALANAEQKLVTPDETAPPR